MELVKNTQNCRSIKGDAWPFPDYSGTCYWPRSSTVGVQPVIIGFCGKIYPVLKLSVIGCSNESLCYCVEDADKFVTSNFREKQTRGYFSGEKEWKIRQRIGITQKGIKEFFEECAKKQCRYENIFVDHGCPVFVAHRRPTWNKFSTITYHGRRGEKLENSTIMRRDGTGSNFPERELLKSYEFYRIFDTYTAFQEISMYFGGILGTANPHIPEVSDLDMRDAKGFDKWSFRKEPSKKK